MPVGSVCGTLAWAHIKHEATIHLESLGTVFAWVTCHHSRVGQGGELQSVLFRDELLPRQTFYLNL